MSWLRLTAPDVLVIGADPDARAANPFYRHRIKPMTDAVAESVCGINGDAATVARRLMADPASVAHHRQLVRLLSERLAQPSEPAGFPARSA